MVIYKFRNVLIVLFPPPAQILKKIHKASFQLVVTKPLNDITKPWIVDHSPCSTLLVAVLGEGMEWCKWERKSKEPNHAF